jgi:hypothetical protein
MFFRRALHQSSTTGVRLEAVANIGLAYHHHELSIVYFLEAKTGYSIQVLTCRRSRGSPMP